MGTWSIVTKRSRKDRSARTSAPLWEQVLYAKWDKEEAISMSEDPAMLQLGVANGNGDHLDIFLVNGDSDSDSSDSNASQDSETSEDEADSESEGESEGEGASDD
jgi:hypothetical protein